MRQERTIQATIFEVFAGHQIGCELKAMSGWLDRQRALVSLVAGDLRRDGVRETGRRGLPAEAVLRSALLKQYRQLSYEELAFHLEDSASFRAFGRVPLVVRCQRMVPIHWLNRTTNLLIWWADSRNAWEPSVSIGPLAWSPKRSVLHGQAVPAGEKLVSLFEPHADIILKGGRQVQYGHKLNLVTGKSGLILDVVIEIGNPADAERFLPMLDRHIAHCGGPPRQMAADGGYASRDNLDQAKARGVRDVAFHNKRGLAVADMAKSAWVYRQRRNFRAGIEAGISCFKKRAYGGARCTWRGLDHLKAYLWSAVVALNLVLVARLKPA